MDAFLPSCLPAFRPSDEAGCGQRVAAPGDGNLSLCKCDYLAFEGLLRGVAANAEWQDSLCEKGPSHVKIRARKLARRGGK